MPFTPIDRVQRKLNIQEKFFRETNITRTEEGSVARSFMDAVLSEIEAAESQIEYARSNTNPLTASGPYLRLWGDFFGIQPETAVRAHVRASDNVFKFYVASGTFGDLNNGSNIVINKDDIVIRGESKTLTNRGIESFPVEYELVDQTITLLAGSNALFVGVIAAQPGSEFNIQVNQLTEHTFSSYSAFPNKLLLCTNLAPISNGEDIEDDERYRYRIDRSAFIRVPDVVEKLTFMIDAVPGVTGVFPIRNFSGSGVLDIFVDTQAFQVSPSIINSVREADQSAQISGIPINIEPIRRIGISIELSVKYKAQLSDQEKSQISSELEAFILREILNKRTGERLDLSELYNRLVISYIGNLDIGVANKGFDTVIVYRDSLLGKRSGEVLNTSLGIIEADEFERIVPEEPLIQPVLIRERI